VLILLEAVIRLDWLMDHKAEFELLVMKKLDDKAAGSRELP
jgi:hypothetical protein